MAGCWSLKIGILQRMVKAIIECVLQDSKMETLKMEILFSWVPKSLRTVPAAMKLKDICSLEVKL